MQTYSVIRLKSGNIGVDYNINHGTGKPAHHEQACLVTTGPEAGKWIEKGAQFPAWGITRLQIQAESAREAAEKLPAVEAQRIADDEKVRTELVGEFTRSSCFQPTDQPYTAIRAKMGRLVSDAVAAERELIEFKASPAKLRAALKKLEAKVTKEREANVFAALCKKASQKLKTGPTAPLKGAGYAREDFAAGNNKKLSMILEAIPSSHKDKIAQRRQKGHFSWSVVISPEAAKAFAKLIAAATAPA